MAMNNQQLIAALRELKAQGLSEDFSIWLEDNAELLNGSALDQTDLLAVYRLTSQFDDTPEGLDELVHSATERHADKTGTDIDELSASASSANNLGAKGQLAYLASLNWTAEAILAALAD